MTETTYTVKTVQAYNNLEMWFHKHMIHFVVFLTLSGLPLLSDIFSFIPYGIGYSMNFLAGNMESEAVLASGISVLRVIHWITAFTFTVTMVPFMISMTQKFFTLSIWPDKWGLTAVFEGIGEMKKCYIDQEHADQGKLNTGQKASAWLLTLSMALVVLSGYVLVLRNWISQDLASIARGVHSVGFIVLVLTLLIHIYFATHPANRAAYKAMFKTGEMDEAYVKSHHPIWYRKLMKL